MSGIKQQVKNNRNNKDKYHSPTWGELNPSSMMGKIFSYIGEDPTYKYRVIIGTDSQSNHIASDFVTAIIVHRVGAGGIYFWQRETLPTYSLRDRIHKEALQSLVCAQKVTDEFVKAGILEHDFLEIHVDVGRNGETRELISEVVGMIRGNGFNVKIKPDAYGASIVADRHT